MQRRQFATQATIGMAAASLARIREARTRLRRTRDTHRPLIQGALPSGLMWA